MRGNRLLSVSFIFSLFFVFSALADEIVVPSGNNIQDAINGASQGDVIILEDGGVYNQTGFLENLNLAISGMEITIKAEDGASNMPEVIFAGFNIDGEFNAVTIQGIKFTSRDNNEQRTSYFINFTESFVYGYHLKVLDCIADGFKRCVIRADRVASTCDSLVFDNNQFLNLDESYRLFHFGGNLEYSYFQLSNTTVANFTERIIWSTSFSQKEVIIDNCTFDGLTAANAGVIQLDGDPGSSLKLTNCLLTNFEDGAMFDMEFIDLDTVRNSRFFNIGDTANTWAFIEDFIEEDPQYADRENLDFTLPEESPLRTAGTDGGPIGDPRWAGIDVTDISKEAMLLPAKFELQQNFPNPFNPSTTIEYTLPESGHVTLEVFNVSGQRIATLVNTMLSSGRHSTVFDGQGLANGIYFYRLALKNNMDIKKMVLIK